MVKKRKTGNSKKYIKYEILTNDLLEVICFGYMMLDRSDIDIDIDLKDKNLVKEIWNMHKKEVMEIWRSDPKGNTGHRPLFFWIVNEAIEPRLTISFRKYKKLTGYKPLRKYKEIPDPRCQESDRAYLRRLGLLEEWELNEIEREKREGIDKVYNRNWELI